MVDVIGYVMVALLIISFTYGLLRQIQHTLAIQNANKTDVSNYKRALFGNYIVCISFLGFLISYMLNILVAMQIIQSNIFTSKGTSFSCFVFLSVLLITKFGVIPKNHKPNELLN